MYKEENREYWEDRATGYSEVNQLELHTEQHKKWSDFLDRQIQNEIPNKDRSEIRILEVGTGPGFFAIILSELGYAVTAIDYTKEMLKQAKQNSKEFGQTPCFMEMDAQNLTFENNTFDVVISRNVTWNLPDPEQAYKEWIRVLRKDGILLVFDANWYGYLYDEEMRKGYEEDRKHTEALGIKDEYTCTDIDRMERIAKKAPLSNVLRPAWDGEVLRRAGVYNVRFDLNVWREVWSEEEKINFSATPMFMIVGKCKR